MTQEKFTVWAFLLSVLFVLLLHACVLWRGLWHDSLRVELQALEAALISTIPAGARSQSPLRRLHALLHNARRFAGSLTFSRVLLARLLLPASTRTAPSCRQSLQNLEDSRSRETSLALYADFERLVARRIAVGSPLLWAFVLYRHCGSHNGPPRSAPVPWIDLLEYTFGPPVCEPLPDTEIIGT